MRSLVPSHAISYRTTPAPFYILMSRAQYSACHISIPEMEKPVAAIRLGDQYYSFFTSVADSKRVLAIAIKLSYSGDETAITKIAKGYAVWVLETDRQLLHRPPSQATTERSPIPTSCRVLVSQDQYQTVNLCVPDLEQSLDAIQFEGKYYSIFRAEADITKLLEIAAKITQRNDEMVITKMDQGRFGICIWEPEGYLNPPQ
jgi:hypothetical protein